MLDDAAAIAEALAGTVLDGRAVVEFPIVGADQLAFGVACDAAEVAAAWEAARGVVAQTGRWPVVADQLDGHSGPGWLAQAAEARFQLLVMQAEMRYATGDHSLGRPEFAITVPTPAAALADRLARLAEEPADLAAELEATRRHTGTAPTPEEVCAALGPAPGRLAVERWLLTWEADRTTTGAGGRDFYLAWPGPCAVLLLPAKSGWDSLAYLDFFPTGGALGALGRLIAVVGSWHERFAAELMAVGPSMLGFAVTGPPATVEDAWPLAVEHTAVAPLAAPLRRHDQALVGQRAWILHLQPQP